MILNIFGFTIQVHFSIKKDSLIQDLRIIYQTTGEYYLVLMIKCYRANMELKYKKIPSLKESKDYIDNLLIEFRREKSLNKKF